MELEVATITNKSTCGAATNALLLTRKALQTIIIYINSNIKASYQFMKQYLAANTVQEHPQNIAVNAKKCLSLLWLRTWILAMTQK